MVGVPACVWRCMGQGGIASVNRGCQKRKEAISQSVLLANVCVTCGSDNCWRRGRVVHSLEVLFVEIKTFKKKVYTSIYICV